MESSRLRRAIIKGEIKTVETIISSPTFNNDILTSIFMIQN